MRVNRQVRLIAAMLLLVVLPPAAAEITTGDADFTRPAHVILGEERRQLGFEGSLMVIDRGANDGLRPGQRPTLFRPATAGHGPITKIGNAVVASTQPETATVQIGRTAGEVQLGDLVAVHR